MCAKSDKTTGVWELVFVKPFKTTATKVLESVERIRRQFCFFCVLVFVGLDKTTFV